MRNKQQIIDWHKKPEIFRLYKKKTVAQTLCKRQSPKNAFVGRVGFFQCVSIILVRSMLWTVSASKISAACAMCLILCVCGSPGIFVLWVVLTRRHVIIYWCPICVIWCAALHMRSLKIGDSTNDQRDGPFAVSWNILLTQIKKWNKKPILILFLRVCKFL